MEITATERFHMYNNSIEMIKNGNKRSICTALRQQVLVLKNRNIPVQEIDQYFPELERRLPLQKDDDNHRIDILIECIKDINYERNQI